MEDAMCMQPLPSEVEELLRNEELAFQGNAARSHTTDVLLWLLIIYKQLVQTLQHADTI